MADASAQTNTPLSDADRALAQQIEAGAFAQLQAGPAMATLSTKAIGRLSTTAAGQARRSVITETNPIAAGPAQPSARIALVSRYDYGSGLTYRTVVNLGTREVLDVKADPNFPTPLADEEAERAIALAAQAEPQIQAGARPRDLNLLPVIDNKRDSPRYGHRLVVVWRDGPPSTRRVLVDLSDGQVANPSY